MKSTDIERIEQYPNSKINKYQNEEKNRGKTYCNPLDIAYKYQHPLFGKYAYKEAADPTRILFKGTYYLFTSHCGGSYYLDDLFSWNFHENRKLEIHGYAPDVSEHDGWLYFCASSYFKKSRILRSQDPLKGFEYVSAPSRSGIRISTLRITAPISIGDAPLRTQSMESKGTSGQGSQWARKSRLSMKTRIDHLCS